MTFERAQWLATFQADDVDTGWRCSTCSRGTLLPIPGSFHEEATRETAQAQATNCIPMSLYEGVFSGMLRCSACATPVAASGSSLIKEHPSNDRALVTTFSPSHLEPAPAIIRVPTNCPRSLATELERAFALYWNDADASANRIRSCVELLLTHLKIPKKARTPKGDFRRLSLHQRIERFAHRKPDLAKNLMALKWLGNDASHGGRCLRREDTLDGFQILEHVLAELFDGNKAFLTKLTRQINRAKGRRRKSPWGYLFDK